MLKQTRKSNFGENLLSWTDQNAKTGNGARIGFNSSMGAAVLSSVTGTRISGSPSTQEQPLAKLRVNSSSLCFYYV